MVVLHAVGLHPGGGALRATLRITQTPIVVHEMTSPDLLRGMTISAHIPRCESIMPRMLVKQPALFCARGTHATAATPCSTRAEQRGSKGFAHDMSQRAAPPPPLRAAMGGSMSSEKKDLDGVACRRGGSPSGMLQLSPIAQAVDTCMVQPRVIATSDKIALRVVPFSPGIFTFQRCQRVLVWLCIFSSLRVDSNSKERHMRE